MATLTHQATLMGATPGTGLAPFGIPACVVLPDGTFAVATGYLSSTVSKIRTYHLDTDLSVLGMLDIDWTGTSFGFPYMAPMEDHTVLMIGASDTFGASGIAYVMDFSGADPVIQSQSITANTPRGGWNGWPAVPIYLREHAILVIVSQENITTYRHGERLGSVSTNAFSDDIIGVWPNPDDPLKFSVDYLDPVLDTYEVTVTPEGAVSMALMSLPTFNSWWPIATSSPYEEPSVVLNTTNTDYEIRSRAGDLLASAPLDANLGETGVTASYVLGLTDAKRLLVAHGRYHPTIYPHDATSRLVDVDFEAMTIDVTTPSVGVPTPNWAWDITTAGSTAVGHRDGRAIVVGNYVDGGSPDYFCLIAWAYDGGVEYPFRVKGDGAWRKIGDGQSADGGRFALHDGDDWCREPRSSEGERILYPLRIKTRDDRWETVAMLTKGESPP